MNYTAQQIRSERSSTLFLDLKTCYCSSLLPGLRITACFPDSLVLPTSAAPVLGMVKVHYSRPEAHS